LVDTSLGRDYDAEEACKYLKIGLLCTQEVSKLRPLMSTVVSMLMGEMDVKDKISRPGLLSEFRSLKGDKKQKDRDQNDKWETKKSSPNSSKLEDSSSSSGMATSFASMTFNSIYDRSN